MARTSINLAELDIAGKLHERYFCLFLLSLTPPTYHCGALGDYGSRPFHGCCIRPRFLRALVSHFRAGALHIHLVLRNDSGRRCRLCAGASDDARWLPAPLAFDVEPGTVGPPSHFAQIVSMVLALRGNPRSQSSDLTCPTNPITHSRVEAMLGAVVAATPSSVFCLQEIPTVFRLFCTSKPSSDRSYACRQFSCKRSPHRLLRGPQRYNPSVMLYMSRLFCPC